MTATTEIVITADTSQVQAALESLLEVITEIKDAWDELPPEMRTAMASPSLVLRTPGGHS